MPQKYDTLLGKWFEDGVELSGGEWRRIGLARSLVRNTPIIALDEPTNQMDSWAEAEWARTFRSLAVGRTAIIITHRFATAVHADEIHVMSDGQVVESGSHSELVKMGGLYAQSWNEQMQSYDAHTEFASSPDLRSNGVEPSVNL